ncbi:MAG: MerR family transcriptional regulator [Casimicrobiaceae bacterium]
MATTGMTLNISAVERETGLSKDVLRMWERRYAFPKPGRDDNGERQYSVTDVAKLRAIKRLMDVGMRPGRLIDLSLDDLNALADARVESRRDTAAPALERDMIALLQNHDVLALQRMLANMVLTQGVQRFVIDTAAALNRAIGDAWMRGELQVFEEHLFTEAMQTALRTSINAYPRHGGTPRVLLTTFPGEQHGLGLLMVEAVLASDGAFCISLGVETPLEEIRRAALAHDAHLVALSFSAGFPVRQASDGLAVLRRELPAKTTLWAGGEMTRRVRKTLPGVVLIPELASTPGALQSWRTHWAQTAHYLTSAGT